jgi:hypothetical protein
MGPWPSRGWKIIGRCQHRLSAFRLSRRLPLSGAVRFRKLQWTRLPAGACLRHDPGIVWTRRDALLETPGDNPCFAAYLKRIGQPPEAEDRLGSG